MSTYYRSMKPITLSMLLEGELSDKLYEHYGVEVHKKGHNVYLKDSGGNVLGVNGFGADSTYFVRYGASNVDYIVESLQSLYDVVIIDELDPLF